MGLIRSALLMKAGQSIFRRVQQSRQGSATASGNSTGSRSGGGGTRSGGGIGGLARRFLGGSGNSRPR